MAVLPYAFSCTIFTSKVRHNKGTFSFSNLQSRTEDKIERFKKAVEYFSAASKPRPLSMGPSPYLCRYNLVFEDP